MKKNLELIQKNNRFGFVLIGLIKEDLDKGTQTLVATDLGYVFGSVYTSMSGAYEGEESGAGYICLYAWVYYLKQLGFKIWDLGMGMKYKTELGGVYYSRDKFVKIYQQ